MPRPNAVFLSLLSALLCLHASRSASADERLKGIACRSVHLAYQAPEGDAFYNEVVVEQSAPGTYFCVCGFSKGYYGIQELANGRKLLIFSVWDPGNQQDPDSVDSAQRVELLHQDPDVRVGRFGNEGTGGQSFLDYDWKIGEKLRLMVKAKPAGENRTAYEAWFFHPEDKKWRHLVTYSTLTKGDLLRGYYSFVEDFRRNRRSTEKTRRAGFGPGWAHTAADGWVELNQARFTGDSNPVMNIDAGLAEGVFYLSTGGEIENTGTELWSTFERDKTTVPEDLEAMATANDPKSEAASPPSAQ